MAGETSESKALPPPSWRIQQPFLPSPSLFEQASPALDRFAAVCALKPGEGRSKAGKRVWGIHGGGSEPPDSKRPRDEGGVATSADGVLAGGALQLQSTRVVKVDSGRPVETFWSMLGDETEDMTLKAVSQLADVVLALLEQTASPTDAHAMKAFRCLRELRRGSVQHEEPESFNTLLKKIKEDLLNTSAKGHFWQALHKELGEEGLITCDETEESEVTAQEATDFWMATKESTQSVEVELEEEEEDEFGDFD